MRKETIGTWLDELASAAPAPGGGAAAALGAATAAALVSMVCNLTLGRPRYAAAQETMTRVLAEATALRAQAVDLAEADAEAFTAVTDAYRLPHADKAQAAIRSATIQAALIDAAEVPLRTAAVAAAVIALAGQILDGANVNVISDVAVAAAGARAALEAATVNVEVNLAMMSDPDLQRTLRAALADHATSARAADAVVTAVRERINA